MKSTLLILFLSTIISMNSMGQQFPSASGPTPGSGLFGIGLVFGEPTGISAKYWTRGDTALDFALGASFYSDFRFHGTYLFHVDAFDYQRLPLHYGIGFSVTGKGERSMVVGRNTISHRSEVGIGPRGAFGVSYLLPSAPFDIFLELGATLFIVAPVGLELDILAGTRIYF